MSWIKKIYQNHRGKIIFVSRFAILWVLWKAFFFITWRTPELLKWYNSFSLDVIALLLEGTYYLMTALGETMELDYALRIIRIKGTVGVTVGEPCIGFDLNAIYIGLILSASGKVFHKFWFLITGVAFLIFLNIVRIASLAYLVEINPWLWEVNHKFVFSIVIYFFLFIIWRIWLQNFSRKTSKVVI
jgi:exosortase/archaeosortase family protein